ncbi:MAG: hypothetical protein KGJ62_09200 [Armatimonadetes bacterium]|nr:hypothetical protein [Armatimonadota bacterium]MDE2207590.1 hypothetical protein [Armatimonadota bacterium]
MTQPLQMVSRLFSASIVLASAARTPTHEAGPAAPIYGLTGVQAYFAPGTAVPDAIRARYRFRVVADTSPTTKIVFGYFRLHGSGKHTVMIESKAYADGLAYADYTHTTWPMHGKWKSPDASYRIAVEDRDEPGVTGAKTSDPVMFPRQTYTVDGIKGFWKTDMISQANLAGKEVQVEIARGDPITDKTGWKYGGEPLGDGNYREWQATVGWDGHRYKLYYALPEGSSAYLTPEMFSFNSEMEETPGEFTVDFWDYQVYRESTQAWQPVVMQRVTHDDDPQMRFGVRCVRLQNTFGVEISNNRAGSYLPIDSLINLATGAVVPGGTPERERQEMQTISDAFDHIKLRWDQPWVDAANMIFTMPNYDEAQWHEEFTGYFSNHLADAALWNYLQYPSFGWFDDATHRKLESALNAVAKARIASLLQQHAFTLDSYFGSDPGMRDDITMWLNFLKEYERNRTGLLADVDDKSWLSQLAERYPALFEQLTAAQRQQYPATAWLVDELTSAYRQTYTRRAKS